jgi:hypothetical protein
MEWCVDNHSCTHSGRHCPAAAALDRLSAASRTSRSSDRSGCGHVAGRLVECAVVRRGQRGAQFRQFGAAHSYVVVAFSAEGVKVKYPTKLFSPLFKNCHCAVSLVVIRAVLATCAHLHLLQNDELSMLSLFHNIVHFISEFLCLYLVHGISGLFCVHASLWQCCKVSRRV